MTMQVRDATNTVITIPKPGTTRFIVASGTALTRPANTTAYSAGDSVSDNATAGSVTANSITVSDVADQPVTVEVVTLTTADTGPGAAGATFDMHIFDSDPTASSGVGAGDNAAWTQKRAGWVGKLSGTFFSMSDGSVARLVPASGDNRIITTPVSGAMTLYWQLVAVTGWTPSANSTTFTPTFEGFFGRA